LICRMTSYDEMPDGLLAFSTPRIGPIKPVRLVRLSGLVLVEVGYYLVDVHLVGQHIVESEPEFRHYPEHYHLAEPASDVPARALEMLERLLLGGFVAQDGQIDRGILQVARDVAAGNGHKADLRVGEFAQYDFGYGVFDGVSDSLIPVLHACILGHAPGL
jgi:hypothetical protein